MAPPVMGGIAVSTIGFLSQNLQGAIASLLALSGSYERILGFVVAVDWVFFGLTALALVVLRRRDRATAHEAGFRVPGHPFTTMLFVAGAWLLLAGIAVYLFWRRRAATA